LKLKPLQELNVFADIEDKSYHVGALIISGRNLVFEYESSFISKNIELSPIKLPIKNSVYQDHGYRSNLKGLPGLFCDSLPDAWGMMLMNRWAEQHSIPSETLTPVDRLAYMADRAMGSLRFEPNIAKLPDFSNKLISIKDLADESINISKGQTKEVIDEVLAAGGSPGGARPKALVGLTKDNEKAMYGIYSLPENYDHFVLKFRHSQEPKSTGALEYVYSIMAKDSGIDMPETRLVEAGNDRYFAIKRFDRIGNLKLHAHTLGGLLHSDFQAPDASYRNLFGVTSYLTNDMSQSYEVLRRLAFNVYSNNRDDHVNNFSFLMNSKGKWKFSPAYDLMYSPGPGGWHTLIIGNKENPTDKDILSLAKDVGLKYVKSKAILEEVKESVSKFNVLCKKYDINKEIQKKISKKINTNLGKDVER